MKRRALIIYCNDTGSGPLTGPPYDNSNFLVYLTSRLGGEWYPGEILSLRNPKISEVSNAVSNHMKDADYTFTLFTGHGYINRNHNDLQYLEVADGDVSILKLRNGSLRQTIVIDACRGYYVPEDEAFIKGFRALSESFTGDIYSTRQIFDRAVLAADQGLTVLFAASENQTALDTGKGAAYLRSLLKVSENWEESNRRDTVLDLKTAHANAKIYLSNNFATSQVPAMTDEKRLIHFPFGVKPGFLH